MVNNGDQWSNGEQTIDQIANLIEGIKNNPDSRRILLLHGTLLK